MATLKIGAPLLIAMVLLAQSAPTSGFWENLTALGILAVVAIWLVTKTLPQFAKTLQTISKDFAETAKAISADHTHTSKTAFAKIDAWLKQ